MDSRRNLVGVVVLVVLLALAAGPASAAVRVVTLNDAAGDVTTGPDIVKVSASFDEQSGVVGLRFTTAGAPPPNAPGEATFDQSWTGSCATTEDAVRAALQWNPDSGALYGSGGAQIAEAEVSSDAASNTVTFHSEAPASYRNESYLCVGGISLGDDVLGDAQLAGVVVAEGVTLDRSSYFVGDSAAGRVLWRNEGPGAMTMAFVHINGQPQGPPHAGATDWQFKPAARDQTIQPNTTKKLEPSLAIPMNAPLGAWEAYGTWQDQTGLWHETAVTPFSVLARDGDADGVFPPDHGGLDCNDANPAIRPGAPDAFGNGVDENCDGVDGDGRDGDRDGALPPAHGGSDCNDANAAVRPGATDTFGNDLDENCDGADGDVRDRDHDGVAPPLDCDDGNPNRSPTRPEIEGNAVDENCDGFVAPFDRVGANATRTLQPFRRHAVVVRLVVTDLPAGATVTVRCRGSRSCPRRLFRQTVDRATSRLVIRRYLARRRLAYGATVEVRVTAPGMTGRVFIFRIARRGGRIERCLPPGTSRPIRC